MKVIVTHPNGNNLFLLRDREIAQLLKKRCADLFQENPDLLQSFYHKILPVRIASQIVQCKLVFMVDPRPVGYDLGRSVYIVRQVWDDQCVVNVFEDAATKKMEMAEGTNKGEVVVHNGEYSVRSAAQRQQSKCVSSSQSFLGTCRQPNILLSPLHELAGNQPISEHVMGESSAGPAKCLPNDNYTAEDHLLCMEMEVEDLAKD
ncbi:hypothetical protein PIB30_068831 [Stylosanthes scabra]|uniref:Uncharacterized protein n=1 Tax=Stylosanthes scabra TaxID=79078 RepID=A0ABU6VMH9_9FABA|nr:hypothetical protein [Stylosanthes scabra]